MFNKDLYYKKYLKYKNKYIDLQSQLGGAPMYDSPMSDARVSDVIHVSDDIPLIVSSTLDERIIPKFKNNRQPAVNRKRTVNRERAFKPTKVQLNPTTTSKPNARLLPYLTNNVSK